jgi:hypothetical protein
MLFEVKNQSYFKRHSIQWILHEIKETRANILALNTRVCSAINSVQTNTKEQHDLRSLKDRKKSFWRELNCVRRTDNSWDSITGPHAAPSLHRACRNRTLETRATSWGANVRTDRTQSDWNAQIAVWNCRICATTKLHLQWFRGSLVSVQSGAGAGFYPGPSVQYHSTIAPYSSIHLPPTLYNVSLPVLQFPLSVSFHHCSILIHPSKTHAVYCFYPSTSVCTLSFHQRSILILNYKLLLETHKRSQSGNLPNWNTVSEFRELWVETSFH